MATLPNGEPVPVADDAVKNNPPSFDPANEPLLQNLPIEAPTTLDELIGLIERKDAIENVLAQKERAAVGSKAGKMIQEGSFGAFAGGMMGLTIGGFLGGPVGAVSGASAGASSFGFLIGAAGKHKYAAGVEKLYADSNGFFAHYKAARDSLTTLLTQYERIPTEDDVVLVRYHNTVCMTRVNENDGKRLATKLSRRLPLSSVYACLAPDSRVAFGEDVPNRAGVVVLSKEKDVKSWGFVRANTAGKLYLYSDVNGVVDPSVLSPDADAWYLKPVLRDSAVVKPVEGQVLR